MDDQYNTVYSRRDQILKEWGFENYSEYRKSWIWHNIRDRVFKKYNYKCLACGNKAQVIHHRSYDIYTLSGYNLKSLISLCHFCHSKVEMFKNSKLPFNESEQRLRVLIKKRNKHYKKLKQDQKKWKKIRENPIPIP